MTWSVGSVDGSQEVSIFDDNAGHVYMLNFLFTRLGCLFDDEGWGPGCLVWLSLLYGLDLRLRYRESCCFEDYHDDCRHVSKSVRRHRDNTFVVGLIMVHTCLLTRSNDFSFPPAPERPRGVPDPSECICSRWRIPERRACSFEKRVEHQR